MFYSHLANQWLISIIHGGAISLVSAATTDLSDLINRLDLSVTPECSPVKGWKVNPGFTPNGKNGIAASPPPSLPGSAKKWNLPTVTVTNGDSPYAFNPKTASNLHKSTIPNFATAESSTMPAFVATSTFGRRTLIDMKAVAQVADDEEEDDDVGDTSVDYGKHNITSHLHSLTTDGAKEEYSYNDSPLKARSKLAGGGMLTGAKLSTGTMLSDSGHRSKASTGTTLSVFGPPPLTHHASNSLNIEEAGDLSLATFGDHDEDEDSDIPDELQELLSSQSESGGSSCEDDHTMSFRDVSIPSSTAALMSRSYLAPMPIDTTGSYNPTDLEGLPPTHAPDIPLPQRPSFSSVYHERLGSRFSDDDEEEDFTSSDCSTSTMNLGLGTGVRRNGVTFLSDEAMAETEMQDEEVEEEAEIGSASDGSGSDRGDDTGKASFDFTKELNRLNQGGTRQSFVEQLENAFKTPVETRRTLDLDNMPPVPMLNLSNYNVSFSLGVFFFALLIVYPCLARCY